MWAGLIRRDKVELGSGMGVVWRFLSLVLVVLALMVLGGDVLSLFETATYDPRSMIRVWSAISDGSAMAFQNWVNGLPDFLAGVLQAILEAPGFVILGLPGILLGLLAYGRR